VKTEYIRDPYNIIIGIVEYLDNGDKRVREFPSQKILGFYMKSTDTTTDATYRILSQGDTVISLLYK